MQSTAKEAAKALPEKSEGDDLAGEMDYTQQVIDVVAASESLLIIPIVKEKLDMLRETLDDIADHCTTSLKDRDARVGHKSADDAFYGYKTHGGDDTRGHHRGRHGDLGRGGRRSHAAATGGAESR